MTNLIIQPERISASLSAYRVDPLSSPTRCREEGIRDAKVINSYREQMEAGNWDLEDPSSIILYVDGSNTWIGRGHYVIAALQSLGIEDAAVTVREGSLADAMLFAASDSRSQENRSSADKHIAAQKILTAWAMQFANSSDDEGNPVLSLNNVPWTKGRTAPGQPIYSYREVARMVGFPNPDTIRKDADYLMALWTPLQPEEMDFLTEEFPLNEVADSPLGRGVVVRHDEKLGPILQIRGGKEIAPKTSLKSVDQRPNRELAEQSVVSNEELASRIRVVERELENRVKLAESSAATLLDVIGQVEENIEIVEENDDHSSLLALVCESMREYSETGELFLPRDEVWRLLCISLENRNYDSQDFSPNT